MSFTRETIPDWLTWLLSVLELVIVLAIAVLTGYVVFCLLFGTSRQSQVVKLIQVVNENWKAALVLLIPLVYRPLRVFLENLEEAGGFKRRKIVAPTEKQEEANPETGKP